MYVVSYPCIQCSLSTVRVYCLSVCLCVAVVSRASLVPCHLFVMHLLSGGTRKAFHFIINIYKENKYYISKSKTAVVIFTWEELVQVLAGLVPDKDL